MDEKIKKEDLELVKDFKNGSEEAFNQLISRYASKMFQTAYGLIGSREDAEEVVQDAFVRIYKHLDQFRGDSSFSTWVYRIVVNLSRNKYQWNKRRGSDLTFSISGDYGDDDGRKEDFNIPDTKLGPLRVLEEADEERRIIDINAPGNTSPGFKQEEGTSSPALARAGITRISRSFPCAHLRAGGGQLPLNNRRMPA